MEVLRRVSEGLARRTSRRGLFGRGVTVATGALLGAAAGSLAQTNPASAGLTTFCQFPGPPCPCNNCSSGGVCAKPCMILTEYYASGCWVVFNTDLNALVTCCDCVCPAVAGDGWCGCGGDYHNNPLFCP
ncbi:MAG: hypothetical protein WEE64_11680 [Dehalococcoidia bacterium]